MMISAVPHDKVAEIWPKVVSLLQMATDTTGPRFGVFDIFHGLLNNELSLWVVIDEEAIVAAFTTRIIQYTECKGLSIDWVGGSKMFKWLPEAMDVLKDYAKREGCERLEGYGRPAWGRVLAKDGWVPEYTAYKLELKDE